MVAAVLQRAPAAAVLDRACKACFAAVQCASLSPAAMLAAVQCASVRAAARFNASGKYSWLNPRTRVLASVLQDARLDFCVK